MLLLSEAIDLTGVKKKTAGKSIKEFHAPLQALKETGNELIAAKNMKDAHREMMVFFNAMDEVFFSVDMINFQVIQISAGCERLYGYKADKFLADHTFWFELIHPDDRHIVENEDKILRLGEQVNNQYRIIRKDNTIRWVENKIIPGLDENGTLVRVDGITRDITKRKLDEEALKKSEANLRTIFDNTDTAYILFNAELRIVSFNAIAQKYSEEQNSKSLVVNYAIRDYFSIERWPFIQGILNKVAADEAVSYELSYTKPNGTVHWNEVRWLNVKNTDNKNWGFILANKDITEAKTAELERERITADLIQHNKDLEQFTYIISHNLRAPVANIIGLSDMLKEHELDAESKQQVLDRVSLSIKNIDTVIQDLNNILQARELVHEKKETVYFNDLMGAIRNSIHNIVVSEHVQFECFFGDIDSTFTIRSYLYSIFYNLTSNSIKYRQAGIDPIISIRSQKVRDKIELRFKDNGKGIDLEKNSEYLFGLYKRFDTTMEGKGMGLFMVKTQVEALGGTIRIKSKLGQGTEFIIMLPA
jgi:PAS domain S-box-containing protein